MIIIKTFVIIDKIIKKKDFIQRYQIEISDESINLPERNIYPGNLKGNE